MEPNETAKTIQSFLQEKGYKVLEMDEPDVLTVRYQMSYINIFCMEEDGSYITMILPNLDTLDEGDAQRKLAKCIESCRTLKVVKVFPVSTDNVVASYEFYYDGTENLHNQVERGLKHLIAAKVSYNKL